jgi:hypothetical protein
MRKALPPGAPFLLLDPLAGFSFKSGSGVIVPDIFSPNSSVIPFTFAYRPPANR